MTIEQLQRWKNAKERETQAQEERRAIEDEITASIILPLEGYERFALGDEVVKITTKLNRKVDNKMVDDMPEIHKYFRKKYELDKRNFDTAPDDVKALVYGAITTEPARPSFSLELKKGE